VSKFVGVDVKFIMAPPNISRTRSEQWIRVEVEAKPGLIPEDMSPFDAEDLMRRLSLQVVEAIVRDTAA